MAQLHLRLRPGERGRALEGVGVVMLVDGIEQRLARGRHHRPEGDARRAAGRNAQPPAQREHRVEHGPTVLDSRRPSIAAMALPTSLPRPRKRARSVSISTSPIASPSTTARWAAHSSRLVRAAAPARRQDGAGRRQDTRSARRAWRRPGARRRRRRRQHDLGVGGDLDVARLAARVGDRHAPHLGVVLRRHDDVEGGGERAVAPHELRAILGEHDVVAVGPRAARLVGRRPHRRRCRRRAGRRSCPNRRASCPRASA